MLRGKSVDQRISRSNRLEIRLAAEERTQIEQRARANGVTLSRYLRHAALGIKLPRRRVNVELEAVAALNRIGVNLNQIARAANHSGRLESDQQLLLGRTLEQVSKTISRITENEGTSL